jgi:conjugative relaxase-like TrwC/TraI family protein
LAGAVLDWKELDPRRLANYWLAKVANGIEDYYAGEGESAGEWYGAGASALGLEGRINGNDLTAVLRSEYGELQTMSHKVGPGYSPYSGGARTVRRRPGWDFCFRAPKSVSLIYGFGDLRTREEVVAAHDAAVKEALDYAQRHLTRTRRTIDGRRQHVQGEGLICARFRHRISRAGDPLLHTHALVVNATRDDRGRWLRLNAPWLLGPSKTLGYLYQAKLRAELSRRLGVEWEPVRRGYADVRGIRRETIEAFSRRRTEILELLDERGQGPEQAEAAQQAAYGTRRAKDRSLAPKDLRDQWREYAREADIDESEIEAAIGRRREARPGSAAELRRTAHELTVAQGIVREAASVSEHEIVRAICERLPDGADLASIEACAAAVRSSDELVRLDPPEHEERITELRPESARYTTRGLLAAERELLDAAVAGQGSGGAVVPRRALEGVLADPRWSGLTAEQGRMVRALATDSDRLGVVRGDAGTGKTFALGAYRAVMEAAGWQVVGAANTRRAAAELGEVGIRATSVAATLADIQRFPQRGLGRRTVLVVDEAGTASTWDLRALYCEVQRSGGKLVLVGDPRQLGAIGPGGAFRSLLERLPAIELRDVIRQRLPADREAIAAQKADRFGEALGIYAEDGRVEVCESQFLTRAAVVEGWGRDRDPEGSLMIARANRDVAYLNRAARARLEADGTLGGEAVEVAGESFRRGDVIVTRARAYAIGVRNQDRWRVLEVDADAGAMEVERIPNRHPTRLGREYLSSTGWGGVPAIQHGYAGTIAITQGTTVERAHVLLDGGLDGRDIYTATTRSRSETRLYLTDATVTERSEIQPEAVREIDDPYHDVLRGVDRTRPDFASHEERHRQAARRMSERELRRRQLALRGELTRTTAEAELRAELAAVREELAARRRAELAAARRIQPAWVEGSIGPMPETSAERRRWEARLADLVAYRQRFGVHDRHSALGGRPRSAEQAAEWRRLQRPLAEAAAGLEPELGEAATLEQVRERAPARSVPELTL